MATYQPSQDQFLRNALRGNTVFSGVSAAAMIVAAGAIAQFMGLAQSIALVIIGVILIFHGVTLWQGSRQSPVSRMIAWYAIIGDIGWIVGSIAIIWLDPWQFTVGGKWLIAILADIVAVFAILQYIGLRRLNK